MTAGDQPGTAVVVGGASGLGAAVVHAYRNRNVPVVIWDIADGADIICDVREPDSMYDATRTTIERVGVPL
jgi:NAD(P)-dependent dehydrogenase (short-subunit alcohol dehydrogenase family)